MSVTSPSPLRWREAPGEGEPSLSLWYHDGDDDSYGDPSRSEVSCEEPEDASDNAGDCHDDDDAINEGASELCDGSSASAKPPRRAAARVSARMMTRIALTTPRPKTICPIVPASTSSARSPPALSTSATVSGPLAEDVPVTADLYSGEGSHVLVLAPGQDWAEDGRYTLTIAESDAFLGGETLLGPWSWTFRCGGRVEGGGGFGPSSGASRHPLPRPRRGLSEPSVR